MSAFFISINRNGANFEQTIADKMMCAIDHFGIDGRKLVVESNFALGYQSLWTVPEEQGEQQPLYDEASQSYLVFYGRIDNRSVLMAKLDFNDQSLSDATVLHQYLLRFGASALGDVVGPFVFVLFNVASGEILAARDPMGGRNLVYSVTDQVINISTYELPLVAHPSLKYKFNKVKLAKMLANMMEDVISSTIKGVDVLSPGELFTVAVKIGNKVESRVFYRHEAGKRVHLNSDEEYALEFRRLLNQAVSRRARSIGPIASMMSGGFDSVPMSILLSKIVEQRGEKLTALSWVFDDYPEADERQYSSPVCERFDIEQVCINCDDVWPALDDTTHVDPVMPFGIPFSEFQQKTLAEAQSRGIRTVMTGIHGDLLYTHTQPVLFELLARGQFKRFWSELSVLSNYFFKQRYLVKHFFIAQLPGVAQFVEWRRGRRAFTSPLINDSICKDIKHQKHPLFKQSLKATRPTNYRSLFDGYAGEDQSFGRHMEAKFSVERRYPFRDRDLCEFVASISSDQLFLNMIPRPIVRNAFIDELEPLMLKRTQKTDFSSVITAGIKKHTNWHDWYYSKPSAWTEFVKQCYFESGQRLKLGEDIVKWRCGYYDYWKSMCYNRVVKEMGLPTDE